MTTLCLILGLALVVAGVAQVSVPAAFIVGGVALATGAVLLERGSSP